MNKEQIDKVDVVLGGLKYNEHYESFAFPEYALAIRELAFLNKKWDDLKELERSINALHRNGKDLSYQNLDKEYKRNFKDDRFEFLIAVDYPISNDIQLEGVLISMVTGIQLEEKICALIACNDDSRYIPNDIEELKKGTKKFLSFQIIGNDFSHSEYKFRNIHALLKGVIEYSYSTQHWNPGQPYNRQNNVFFYPRFILAISNEGTMILNSNKFTRSGYRPNDEHLPKLYLNKILSFFEKGNPNDEYYKFMADIFRLYGVAVDANTNREAFLLYWNALEKMLEPFGGTGDTKHIIKRANLFQISFFKDYEYTFKYLATIRNDLVHRGIDNVDPIYVGLLTVTVRRIIEYLFDKIGVIDSKEKLETLLTFLTIPYSTPLDNLELVKEVFKKRFET